MQGLCRPNACNYSLTRKRQHYNNHVWCKRYSLLLPSSPIKGGQSRVRYQVDPASDHNHQFDVDEAGAVRLVGRLDREAADNHSVLVWAVDDGEPRRTATATLAVSLR